MFVEKEIAILKRKICNLNKCCGNRSTIPSTVSAYSDINSTGFYWLDTVDGNNDIGLYVINEAGTITYLGYDITYGTYAELKLLADSNELQIGKKYILTDYQTKYYIEGTNTGVVEKEIETKQTTSGWGSYDPPISELSVGDSVTITFLPTSYVGALSVGDITTVTSVYSGGYYLKFGNGMQTIVGSKFSFTVDRFNVNTSMNGVTIMDNGKPAVKPDGVVNTDVHDGTPYLNMTALENKKVATEQIMLTAISDNLFSIDAESITYIGDVLEYDFKDSDVKNEDGKIIDNRKGFILRRNNKSLGINISADWREQRFRRYKVTSEWEDYVLNNSVDSTLYQIGGNNSCTVSNINITEEHKYILLGLENLNFYNDFTKKGTVANIFLSGEATAPSILYGGRFGGYQQNDFKQFINVDLPKQAKDFFIFEVDVNRVPSKLVGNIYINNFSNTVFMSNDMQYGKSNELIIDIKDGIHGSTFITLPKIYSNSSKTSSSLFNITAIDWLYLTNTGDINNMHILTTSELSNGGEVTALTIGAYKSNVTGFGVSYAEIFIDDNSEIINTIIGGKRVDSLRFENTTINKFLYTVTRLQYTRLIDSFFYLVGIKHGGDSVTNKLRVDLGTNKNPKKNLYGYYYDTLNGTGQFVFDNNLGDLLYKTIDGNNSNIMNLNTYSISQ